MKHYVYILQSEVNGRFYIGSCSNPEVRLSQHNAGRTHSTKPYRPWKLMYYEEFSSNAEARKRELKIKKMNG
jgi:putative endonuclease